MALILRNGGSQSPDRWLKEPRNNQNTLNEKENIFYTENNEMIEDVLKQLLEIHKNVYRR